MRQGLAANEIGDLDAPANPDAVDRLHFGQLRSLLRMLVLFSPVLILSYLGWRHRWIADDAFINFRIVKQLEAGHGPVFNIGTRVESGTSPLWLAVLAIFDAITPVPIDAAEAEKTAPKVGHPMVGWRQFQPLYDWIVEVQPGLLDE